MAPKRTTSSIPEKNEKRGASFLDALRRCLSEALNALGTAKFWKEILVMTLGMLVASAGVYYFLLPGNIVLGSMTGLSMVISAAAAQVGLSLKVSVVIVIVNAILLLLAWLLIGKEFGLKTVYTSMILGPLMEFWETVLPYTKLIEPGQTSVMGEIWFDLLCVVLLVSISQTILFHINASTGGLDILAKIVNKYLHLDLGVSVTVAGAMICCTAFAINPFNLVVVGLIGTWINGLALDYFTASMNRKKRVCIISKDFETIRKFIIEDLHRGCSIYDVIGGYSGEIQKEVQSILTTEEFSSLMAFLKANNVGYFLTAGNVSEIYGKWNSKSRTTS